MTGRIVSYIDGSRAAMLDLLREMVLIPSGTGDGDGAARMVRAVVRALEGLSLNIETPGDDPAGLLVASTPSCANGGNILILGHMDTVFPPDAIPFWREEGERIVGPGVIDMKGGLVAAIFAVRALAARGVLAEMPLRMLFNADEEVGSLLSRTRIALEARKSAMAFVFECGGPDGGIVTGRKGRLGLKLYVEGRAGHAANTGDGKASAILELAHRIIAIEKLHGAAPGLTTNVGLAHGGAAPNIVPAEAWAAFDVRFADIQGRRFFEQALARLVAAPEVRGTACRIEQVSERPVMAPSPGNRTLFGIAADQAKRLGIPVEEEFRSGSSDANLAAAEGVPVIDGMGPLGEGDHSEREYMHRESLFERTKLAALTIFDAWTRFRRGELPGRRDANPWD